MAWRMDEFLASLANRADGYARRGYYVRKFLMNQNSVSELLVRLKADPYPELVDLTPELRIHAIPVRVIRSVPFGQVWYRLERIEP
jgi:hypothetical protein